MSENEDDTLSVPIAGDAEVEGSTEEADASADESTASASGSGGDVLDAIDREVTENDVVLYMKGTPNQPMCGFSARAAKLLYAYDVPFHAVNVLEEEDKREGVKDYGDWATIPQLYVAGDLVGGSDIVMEMHESGELAELFEENDIETAV